MCIHDLHGESWFQWARPLTLLDTVSLVGLPADVRAGYFPGRSGNAVVKPLQATSAVRDSSRGSMRSSVFVRRSAESQAKDMAAIFVDQSTHSFFSGASESMGIENVAVRATAARESRAHLPFHRMLLLARSELCRSTPPSCLSSSRRTSSTTPSPT